MDESIRGMVPAPLDDYLERLRKQLPPAPEGLLNAYARFMPWISIIFGAIGLFFLIIGSLFLAVLGPFMMLAGASGVSAGLGALFGILVGIVISVLAIAGGLMMRRFSVSGWYILAAALVVQALDELLTLRILTLIITVLVAYVHLQVRPRYT